MLSYCDYTKHSTKFHCILFIIIGILLYVYIVQLCNICRISYSPHPPWATTFVEGRGLSLLPSKGKGEKLFPSIGLSLSLSAPLPISVREEVWRWGAKKPLVIPHFTFPPNISQSAEKNTCVSSATVVLDLLLHAPGILDRRESISSCLFLHSSNCCPCIRGKSDIRKVPHLHSKLFIISRILV